MANWIVKIENQDKALETFDTCESGAKMALSSIFGSHDKNGTRVLVQSIY